MRGFFQNLAYKFQGFMVGRNGDDELNHFLSPFALGLMVLSIFLSRIHPLFMIMDVVGLLLMFYILFRMFSKNIYKRQKENQAFLNFRYGNKNKSKKNLRKRMWEERKDYSYYKCSVCKTYVRIKKPARGKKIAITCKKCSNEFIVRT